MRQGICIALALVAAVTSFACGGDDTVSLGAQCELNSDCEEPLVCRLERCRNACAEDRDCAAGLACVQNNEGLGACQIPEERDCAGPGDCVSPLACVAGVCRNTCGGTSVCLTGATCEVIEGESVCVGEADRTDAGMADAGLDSGAVDAGTDAGPPDAGPPDAGGTCDTCIVDVSAGHLHTCAVRMDGTVWCWGSNQHGQLGRDPSSTATASSPLQVAGIDDASAVSTGQHRTCAIRSGGQVWCWGQNDTGSFGMHQLGDGTGVEQRHTPAAVLNVAGDAALSGVVALAGGYWHTCARRSDGAVLCWGQNASYELGDGSTTQHPRPVPPAGGIAAADVGAGDGVSCAAAASGGALRCWGYNLTAAAGGSGGSVSTPRLVPADAGGDLDSGIDQVSVGGVDDYTGSQHGAHSCARSGGRILCWGRNDDGQVGNGATGGVVREATVVVSLGAADVSAGGRHTCIVTDAGRARCWGRNGDGQLGDGATDDTSVPGPDLAGLTGVAQVSAGSYHTCARLEDGRLRCWGRNTLGQLGDGTMEGRTTPTVVNVR